MKPVRPPVERYGDRLHSAQIAQAAAAIFLSIAVNNFPPKTAARGADPIVHPRNRGEVTDDDQEVVRRTPLANQAEGTAITVVAIDPLKTRGIKFRSVESRLPSIKVI